MRDCIDNQSAEGDENDQEYGHHGLLPEVLSAYGTNENNHASDEPPELRHVTHQWSSEPADQTWTKSPVGSRCAQAPTSTTSRVPVAVADTIAKTLDDG